MSSEALPCPVSRYSPNTRLSSQEPLQLRWSKATPKLARKDVFILMHLHSEVFWILLPVVNRVPFIEMHGWFTHCYRVWATPNIFTSSHLVSLLAILASNVPFRKICSTNARKKTCNVETVTNTWLRSLCQNHKTCRWLNGRYLPSPRHSPSGSPVSLHSTSEPPQVKWLDQLDLLLMLRKSGDV